MKIEMDFMGEWHFTGFAITISFGAIYCIVRAPPYAEIPGVETYVPNYLTYAPNRQTQHKNHYDILISIHMNQIQQLL